MPTSLEVLFAPAEFDALGGRDLTRTVCVVFDVLRATSTIVTALANGAAAVVPVGEISEALKMRQRHPSAVLAGERDGVRIQAHLAGGTAFDLGNSPREFEAGTVRGKTIVMTTTNGTRALRACSPARSVLLGSFLNLAATAAFLRQNSPPELLLVCGGTLDQAAYEDALGAGALCELLWPICSPGRIADSALMARRLFNLEKKDLLQAFASSRNGSRLMAQPELRDDVAYCAQCDIFNLVAKMEKDGRVIAHDGSVETPEESAS